MCFCLACALAPSQACSDLFSVPFKQHNLAGIKQPYVPKLYSLHTQRFLESHGAKCGITREHLAMIPIIEYSQGARHPSSLSFNDKRAHERTIKDILTPTKRNRKVAPFMMQYECARLCDGGFACIIASETWIRNIGIPKYNLKLISYYGEATNGYNYEELLNIGPNAKGLRVPFLRTPLFSSPSRRLCGESPSVPRKVGRIVRLSIRSPPPPFFCFVAS